MLAFKRSLFVLSMVKTDTADIYAQSHSSDSIVRPGIQQF